VTRYLTFKLRCRQTSKIFCLGWFYFNFLSYSIELRKLISAQSHETQHPKLRGWFWLRSTVFSFEETQMERFVLQFSRTSCFCRLPVCLICWPTRATVTWYCAQSSISQLIGQVSYSAAMIISVQNGVVGDSIASQRLTVGDYSGKTIQYLAIYCFDTKLSEKRLSNL